MNTKDKNNQTLWKSQGVYLQEKYGTRFVVNYTTAQSDNSLTSCIIGMGQLKSEIVNGKIIHSEIRDF